MQVLQWDEKICMKKEKQSHPTGVENVQFVLYYLLIICTVPCKIPTGVPRWNKCAIYSCITSEKKYRISTATHKYSCVNQLFVQCCYLQFLRWADTLHYQTHSKCHTATSWGENAFIVRLYVAKNNKQWTVTHMFLIWTIAFLGYSWVTSTQRTCINRTHWIKFYFLCTDIVTRL